MSNIEKRLRYLWVPLDPFSKIHLFIEISYVQVISKLYDKGKDLILPIYLLQSTNFKKKYSIILNASLP